MPRCNVLFKVQSRGDVFGYVQSGLIHRVIEDHVAFCALEIGIQLPGPPKRPLGADERRRAADLAFRDAEIEPAGRILGIGGDRMPERIAVFLDAPDLHLQHAHVVP